MDSLQGISEEGGELFVVEYQRWKPPVIAYSLPPKFDDYSEDPVMDCEETTITKVYLPSEEDPIVIDLLIAGLIENLVFLNATRNSTIPSAIVDKQMVDKSIKDNQCSPSLE